MIKVELNNDTEWVVQGKILSDIERIDLSNADFNISIKDWLEHYIRRDDRYLEEQSFIKDYFPTLSISNNEPNVDDETKSESNISTYNNSDDYSLIRNGFQFWISGNTLEFRMCARGTSTLNTSGYYDFQGHYFTGRVGFSIARCSISLNKDYTIAFDVNIIPTLKTSNIYRLHYDEVDQQVPSSINSINGNYPVCPVCSGDGYIVESAHKCPACQGSAYYQDRYNFSYDNSNKADDMIYLNNNSNTYSAEQTTNNNKTGSPTYTPLYGVITSAYMPEYLSNGETIDILNPGISSARNIDFDFDNASSVLIENDKSVYSELPSYSENSALVDYQYFSYNSASIHDNINLTLIYQTISANDNKIRGSKVQYKVNIC